LRAPLELHGLCVRKGASWHDEDMTLIVGAVEPDTGAVFLAGDTKVTWDSDPTRSRKIYTEPALKIVRLSEDLAVGYAGSGPETLAQEVARLRGLNHDGVLAGLQKISGATFILAGRNPGRLWKIFDGEWAEVTNEGLVIAGDDEKLNGATVFEVVRTRFDDCPNDDTGTRLMSTMQHLIQLVKPSSIGGLLVMISATNAGGFRYRLTPSTNFDAIYAGVITERPLRLHTLPGTGDTPGALGFWIEGSGIGYLFKDGEPDVRHELRGAAAAQFVAGAMESFGQSLVLPREDAMSALIRQLFG
jgi:hypothetical protein